MRLLDNEEYTNKNLNLKNNIFLKSDLSGYISMNERQAIANQTVINNYKKHDNFLKRYS